MKDLFGDMIILEEKAGTTSGRILVVRCSKCGLVREVNKYTFAQQERGWSHEKSCHIALKKQVNRPEYARFSRIYTGMVARCNYPTHGEYHRYGERGIKVEFEGTVDFYKKMWTSYLEQVEKYGEQNTTIERLNINGNYSMDNCTWATEREQAVNRSTRRTVIAKHLGTGKEFLVDDFAQFIRDNNLTPSLAYRIIDNPNRTNKGWQFISANGES